jgi:hypothetical protein
MLFKLFLNVFLILPTPLLHLLSLSSLSSLSLSLSLFYLSPFLNANYHNFILLPHHLLLPLPPNLVLSLC